MDTLSNHSAESENNNTNQTMNRTKFSNSGPSILKLIEFGQHRNGNNESIVSIDVQMIAEKASKEFEKLALQNDELFRESLQTKTKYDDLLIEYNHLDEQLKEFEEVIEQNEYLTTEIERLQTQKIMFDQEKTLYIEQVQTLQAQINENNENYATNEPIQNIQNPASDLSSSHSTKNNDDSANLQQEIQKLTQQNTDLLQQIEGYKERDKVISEMEEKLKKSENEIDRLSQNLNKQQNNFIELQKKDEMKLNKVTQQASDDTDSVLNQYKEREAEYLKTIETQQNQIDELQANNEDLDTQKTKLMSTDSTEQFRISRLMTSKNVFFNDEDLDTLNYQNSASNEEETELIAKLKSEITVLKNKMSHYEDETEDSVQRMLSLANDAQNDLLKAESESEYEYVEEEVEIEITDEDIDEMSGVNMDDLVKELESKQNELQENEEQNKRLLLHIEEMESMLANSFEEKEALEQKVNDFEQLLKEKEDNAQHIEMYKVMSHGANKFDFFGLFIVF